MSPAAAKEIVRVIIVRAGNGQIRIHGDLIGPKFQYSETLRLQGLGE